MARSSSHILFDFGVCAHCGTRFRRVRVRQKYCSPEHAATAAAKRRRDAGRRLGSGDRLPDPYVWIYEIWGTGECLYVGKARSLRRRLAQHANVLGGISTEGSRAWMERVDVVAYIRVDPELAAQHQLLPKYGRWAS